MKRVIQSRIGKLRFYSRSMPSIVVRFTSFSSALVILTAIFIAVPAVFFPVPAEAAISLRSSELGSSIPCNSGLTINKPSGVIVGDVMIAQVASDTGSISTPSGWALIDSASYHGGTMHMATFFRIIEGMEGSSFTFPIGGSSICGGGILAFEGVDNGQVVDASGAARTTNSGTGTTISAPSITNIASANTVLVVSMFKATGMASGNFSTVSGMTEQYDFGAAAGAVATDYATQAAVAPTGIKTSTIGSDKWVVHMVALKPATVHMMLFWDGAGAAPAGWSYVTAAEGRYLRADSPGDYGTTGGYATHTHDGTSSVTMSPPSATIGNALGLTNSPASPDEHVHTLPSVSAVSPASNEPASYRLRLIRFNSGVPNIIPAGAIALFDDDPGVPTDGHWTQLAAAHSRVIRIDSTVGNGSGSDTHTHTLTWSGGLGNIDSVINTCLLICSGNNGALRSHTHPGPSSSTSATATAIPPYFQPMLAKVDQATPTLSLGLTAMFDGAPGGGWIIKSDVGGDYHHKFIRPNATYDLGGGAPGHTIPNSTAVTGAASGTAAAGTSGPNAAAAGHTHTLTASWPAYTSDSHYIGNNEYFLPPYYNVVVAEKVNFILSAYRWYDNVASVNVTSPWSALDLAINTAIPALPMMYDPPFISKELRLRVQIEVNNNNLALGEMQFKLQYKEGSDGSCTTGVWTDVDSGSGGGIWRYSPTGQVDGTAITTSVLGSDKPQRYARSATPGTNRTAVDAGETMEWDFHIQHNGAPGATTYSFRLAEDSGILLSEYAFCPTLSARPDTNNQLRHGNFFEGGAERGFSWVD